MKTITYISAAALAIVAAPALAQENIQPVIITGNVTGVQAIEDPVSAPVLETIAEEDDGCSGILMLSVQDGYPLQDLAVDGSNGNVVTQNMLGASCGKFFFDIWSSTDLEARGPYGRRGSGDEIDFEVSYTDTVDTSFGEVRYQLYAGYYALDLGNGLGSTSDDYIALRAEAALPISVGQSTVEPFAVAGQMIGVSSQNEDFSILRTGIRASGPFPGGLVYKLETAHAWNGASFADNSVWRGEASLDKSLSENWTISGGVKITENIGITPSIKAVYVF